MIQNLVDGVLVGSTTYRLVLYDDGGTTEIEYAQPLFGFASQGLSVGEEELILRDGCCDGFVYEWRRQTGSSTTVPTY